MAKGKKGTVKTDAEKEAAFKKAAAKKVNTIARAFSGLAKMAMSTKFKHTPAEVKAMQTYIAQAGEACFDAFDGKKTVDSTFDF